MIRWKALLVDQCFSCSRANLQRARERFWHTTNISLFRISSRSRKLTHHIIPGFKRSSAWIGFPLVSNAGTILKVCSIDAIVKKSEFKLKKRPGHILMYYSSARRIVSCFFNLPSTKPKYNRLWIHDAGIQLPILQVSFRYEFIRVWEHIWIMHDRPSVISQVSDHLIL